MGSVVLNGATSGATTITPTDGVTATLTLPSTTGTLGLSTGSATQSFNAQNTFGFKNRIINGAMVIDQRNAGASVTNQSGIVYTTDRFVIQGSQASKFTAQQNAGSVTPPAGFTNYLGITSSSAYSVASSDFFMCGQWIEGYNAADLNFGTANAKTVTLSFWVRSSLTGTFGGSLNNSDYTRSYPFSYTVSSANTWTQISITIAGDTSGTWLTTNGRGIAVQFGLGIGSIVTTTGGSWAGGFYLSPTGATSVVGTNGATFYITGVQLEVGSSATGFEYRNFQTEFANCQRYYQTTFTYGSAVPVINTITGAVACFSTVSGFQCLMNCSFKVTMRTTPTITTYSYNGTTGSISGGSYSTLSATQYQQNPTGFNVVGTGNSGNDFYCNYQASAEL